MSSSLLNITSPGARLLGEQVVKINNEHRAGTLCLASSINMLSTLCVPHDIFVLFGLISTSLLRCKSCIPQVLDQCFLLKPSMCFINNQFRCIYNKYLHSFIYNIFELNRYLMIDLPCLINWKSMCLLPEDFIYCYYTCRKFTFSKPIHLQACWECLSGMKNAILCILNAAMLCACIHM